MGGGGVGGWGGRVLWGGFGDIAECDVVVGCVLFGMHCSQQKMHFYLIKSRQYLVQSGFEPGLCFLRLRRIHRAMGA